VDKGDGEEEKSGAIVLLNAETLVRISSIAWCLVDVVGTLLWKRIFFGIRIFLNDFDLSVSELLLRFHQPSST